MAHFSPKLSDEEDDMLEHDDAFALNEFDLLFNNDEADLRIDLNRVIEKYLTSDEQAVIIAKLHGYNNVDLDVTRKYWTYHLSNAVTSIKKHLN